MITSIYHQNVKPEKFEKLKSGYFNHFLVFGLGSRI